MRSTTCKKQILENLRQTPIIEFAVKKAGVSRATFYRWKDDDHDFSKAVESALEDGRSVINDLAESKILKKIGNGSFRASKWWLEKNCRRYRRSVQDHEDEEQRKREDERRFNLFLNQDGTLNASPKTLKLMKENGDA